ncbi:MAG: hypothetical protein WA814_02010 [Candidatus Baltobacteraceae bacterium]
MAEGAALKRVLPVALLVLSGCRAGAGPSAPLPPLSASQAQAAAPFTAPGWSKLVPHAVGGWSGKVNAFAYAPSNPQIMYIGGGWGNTPRESPSQMGIYKTVDGGSHWTAIDDGLTNPDGTISSVVNGLWLDSAKPSIVLASTEFGGTFRSSDGGKSWRNVDRSESTRFSKSGATLYLATRRGILASNDDGATWKISLALAKGATTVATAAGSTYAGSTAGDVYRLQSGAWKRVGHPGTGAVHDVAIDPSDRNVVYANVDDAGIWNEHLYGSLDGGKAWARIYCDCAVGAQAIAFSLVVPHRLYLGEDSGYFVYFTADGNPNPKIRNGTQPFGSDTRYIVPVRGKYRSDDACFILQDQGLAYAERCSAGNARRLSSVTNTLAYSFALTPNRKGLLVALQDNGAGSSADGGNSWQYVRNTGEGGEAFVDPSDPQHCYFAHPDEGLFVSLDGCSTFTKAPARGIESLAFNPGSSGTIHAVTYADKEKALVSVSRDGGMTWSATPWQFANPYQIVVSPRNAEWMLVAAGTATSAPRLYYSHDAGRNWHDAAGLPTAMLPNATIYFPAHRLYAAFDPKRQATILLADHDPATDNIEIFRSLDGGATFSQTSTLVEPTTQRPWPNVALPKAESGNESDYYATRFYGNRLVFNPQAGLNQRPAVVLTTRFGAYVSYDVGSTWRRIDTRAIAHHFIGAAWADGYVYLASFGESVIRSAAPLQ